MVKLFDLLILRKKVVKFFMNESRTINSTKNAISSIITKTIVLVLTFITRRFFIEYIGIEYLGINGLFSNVLTLLSMADLGLGTAMNISFYKPIASKDYPTLNGLLYFYRKVYLVIAIVVLIVGVSLIPVLPYIINTDTNIPHLYLYYIIFVLKNVASYLFIYKTALIKADQKQYLITKVEANISVLKAILQLVIIVATHSYLIYIVLDVLAIVVINYISSNKVKTLYPNITPSNCLDPEQKKYIYNDVFSASLYKISWGILNGTDSIIISVILGTIYVGYYSNYLTITSNVEVVLILVFSSITASVGNLVVTSNSDKLYLTYKSMQLICFWLCAFITLSMFFLTQDFIDFWIGNEYRLSNITLFAIVLNMLFSNSMRAIWTFREGTGMYRQIRYVMLATAVLNVVLSIVLGKLLGVAGVIFATTISKLLTYFWYEPYLLFNQYFHKSVLLFYRAFVKNIALIIVAGGVCYFIFSFFPGINIVLWLIKALLCFLVVTLVYYLAYRHTDEYHNVLEKMMFIIKTIKN